jgi:hypothetical protein
MNERIKELAEQAGLLSNHIGPVVETRHMAKKKQDLEKFAELIVRECIELVEDNMDPWITPAFIKEHFGVEE